MPYDEGLAQRIREALGDLPGLSEKKMFGGMAYVINGNMACGVIKDELMVRVGSDGYEKSLSMAHTRRFDFTGKPLRGFIVVTAQGFEDDDALKKWVMKGVDFALSLAAK
jgi:TfoX/Sxy family transcriptional regulator of competence genes